MIPATHAEIEQIYLAAELANCRSLCITSCQSGEGVTSIASALTERYLLAGHDALLVDLNMFKPAFKEVEMLNAPDGRQWVENRETHQLFTGLSVPRERSLQLSYKDPNTLSRAVQQWLSQYERIIIDTSPILNLNKNNIPAQSVASACDKTVLVVMSGTTTTQQVQKAIELLGSDQISLLGTILNARDQPPLRLELIREINRLSFIPKRWRERWIRSVLGSDLLSNYT
ncbi:AAA family ATPase [Vibrio mimicus]|uniref:AAA family ATPase n=1 Tax=Vibrio mimicus TaxID=674 RepID=UPI002F92DAA7